MSINNKGAVFSGDERYVDLVAGIVVAATIVSYAAGWTAGLPSLLIGMLAFLLVLNRSLKAWAATGLRSILRRIRDASA